MDSSKVTSISIRDYNRAVRQLIRGDRAGDDITMKV